MKNKCLKQFAAILLVILILIGGTACIGLPFRPNRTNRTNEQHELADMTIEQQFRQHLMEKYGLSRAEYEIAGIHSTTILSPTMQMNAYLRGGTWETDGFVVWRFVEDDSVGFSDNFTWLFIREGLEAWVIEVASEFFDDVKAFASFRASLPDDFTQDSSERDLAGLDIGAFFVFVMVAPQFEDLDEFYAATHAFFTAWEASDVDTIFRVFYLEQEIYDTRTRENKIEVTSDEWHVASISF